MAEDNLKLDKTLQTLTGMSQEELDARRAQKAELVKQREELAAIKKELEGLGKESVKSSKFLKAQKKLAEDEKKFTYGLIFTALPETIVLFGFLAIFLL